MKITSLMVLTSMFSGDAFLFSGDSPRNWRSSAHFVAANSLKSEGESWHSSAYLSNENRNHWWNNDFLELMSKRWKVDGVRNVLDVGCGVGHWGEAIARVLPDDCTISGIDMESGWIEEAHKNAVKRGISHKFNYQVGNVNSLPFADGVFDVTTCQTLLIHVPDVKQAISEMLRVLKPGGKIIVAEPNNLASSLFFSNHDIDDMGDKFEIAKFQYICEKGKMLKGEGFNSLGDCLPGIFREMKLENIDVYISDKTSPFMPPYASQEERSFIMQAEKWLDEDFWIWSKRDTRRYFLAGGGSEDVFESLWLKSIEQTRKFLEGIKKGTLHTAGGNVMYCISGVKTD